jgi:6-phosphogluconolactonase
MAHPVINVAKNLDALAESAAAHVADLLRRAPTDRPFTIALSGGPEVKPFHRILAEEYGDEIPWSRVTIFWGDERFVPPDHEDSNYLMAKRTLLKHVPIPERNVFRMRTEADSPDQTAFEYQEILREKLGRERGFDLMIMGLGDDAHTASLFPDHEVLDSSKDWVAPVLAPEYAKPRERVTCTLPLINLSANILFLVSGEEKREAIGRVLGVDSEPSKSYPASLVKPDSPVVWFVDEAAYEGAFSG